MWPRWPPLSTVILVILCNITRYGVLAAHYERRSNFILNVRTCLEICDAGCCFFLLTFLSAGIGHLPSPFV